MGRSPQDHVLIDALHRRFTVAHRVAPAAVEHPVVPARRVGGRSPRSTSVTRSPRRVRSWASAPPVPPPPTMRVCPSCRSAIGMPFSVQTTTARRRRAAAIRSPRAGARACYESVEQRHADDGRSGRGRSGQPRTGAAAFRGTGAREKHHSRHSLQRIWTGRSGSSRWSRLAGCRRWRRAEPHGAASRGTASEPARLA